MNSVGWCLVGVAIGSVATGAYCVLWVRRAAESARVSRRGPLRPVTDYSQHRVWEEVHDAPSA